MISEVYILGTEWRVEFKDELTDFGECDVDHRIIRIRNRQTPEQSAETLFHEVAHAIYHLADIKDKDPEETTVTRMAVGLTTFLRDPRNKLARELLLQEL